MNTNERITFHKITLTRRDDDYILSYEHINSHVLIDKEGKQLIKELKTHTIAEVEQKHPTYDVALFVEELIRQGMIYKIGNTVINPKKHLVDVFTIDKKTAQLAKHPVLLGILIGILATAVYLLITQPELTPQPDWIFATQQLSLLIPLIVLAMFSIRFVSETIHHIILQAIGHSRAVALEHRWFFIRPKADLTKLHTLQESAQQHLQYTAIVAALLIFSKAIIYTAITNDPFGKLFSVLAFTHLLGTFLIHPTPDLHFKKQHFFTPKHLFGLLSLVTLIAVYLIPIGRELIRRAFEAAQTPLTHTDGVIALILITSTITFACASTLFDHKYSTNKAYQSLMITATSTSLLVTAILIFAAIL